MSNFLQDAFRALDDEGLERFIRWLNMDRELRIVNLWKQAGRSHEQGTSARQCLHACRYCSRPCIFRASLQTILRCMIVLIGIGATCIGIVKDEC